MKTLLVPLLLAPIVFAQRVMPIETPKGRLEFTLTGAKVRKVGDISLGSVISGIVHSPTPFDIRFLEFEVLYLDQDGVDLRVCDVVPSRDHKCSLRVFDSIPSGGSVQLHAPGNKFNPGRNLPRGKEIVGFSVRLIEASYAAKYKIEIRKTELAGLGMDVALSPSEGISFLMTNTSDQPIEILWDQSSYVNENGDTSRLIHSGVNFIDKDRPQPHSVVPPGAKLKELVYPSNLVSFVSGKWRQTPLFPAVLSMGKDNSALNGLTGKEVRLFLQLMIGEKKAYQTFTFKILTVEY